MNNPHAVRNSCGFTLLELMIVISIMAILVALAAPSFNNLILKNRLSAAAREVVAVVELARSEAIMRSHPVQVIPLNAANWGAGLDVVVDDARDGTYDAEGLVFRSEPAPPGVMVTTAANHSIPSGFLAFNPLGYLSSSNDVLSLVIKATDCTYGTMMRLRLTPAGELVIAEEECS